MSQGLGNSRAAGPSSNNSKRALSPHDLRTLPPIHDDRHQNISKNTSYTSATSQNARSNPPSDLPNDQGSRPTGPVGMQNLLNPSGQNASTETGRRRSADHFNIAPTTGAMTPQLPPSFSSQSPSNKSLPSITPPPNGTYPSLVGQPPRGVLTPRTPSLYSTHPVTTGVPSATIDATKSPFIGSRDPANIVTPPGHNLPAVPQGPLLSEATYGVPLVSNQSPRGRRPSAGALQLQTLHERRVSAGGLSQPPGSQSNSPSTSYSSYSRFSNTPPAPHAVVATSQPSSFFAPHNGKGSTGSMASREPKEAFGPVASSMGHGAMQLMTLDTEQGPIQVPVDVTAASKVADEKRKRNATASHRFRQRRKEKERETSNNIAKLEHQIHELAKERDYYRLERDYFRNVAVSELGQIRLPPRPPSPRQSRLAQQTGDNGVPREGQWQGQEEHSNHGRNTRRRTSSYTPATGVVPPVNAGLPQLQRYESLTSNPSETLEQRPAPGVRNPVPGPQTVKNGAFDPAVHGDYSRGRKPSGVN